MSVTISQRVRRLIAIACGNKDAAEAFANEVEAGTAIVNTEVQTIDIPIRDLAAGEDLTAFPLIRFDVGIVLDSIEIIPADVFNGVDGSNTVVVTVKQTTHTIASVTFDDTNTLTSALDDTDQVMAMFVGPLDATWKTVAANTLLTLTVVCGATADPTAMTVRLRFHQ